MMVAESFNLFVTQGYPRQPLHYRAGLIEWTQLPFVTALLLQVGTDANAMLRAVNAR